MPVRVKKSEENKQLQILETVTSVYSQIASQWMTRTRDSVLRSRGYVSDLNEVFLTVFSSYLKEVERLAKQYRLKRDGKITFLAHNGKQVAVFLSANTGFYGEIVKKTFELFIKDVHTNDYEVTIVGKQGLSYLLSDSPSQPHTFFEISDDQVDTKQVLALVQHLVQYEKIHIYYGKFQNFLRQDPVVFTLSANPYETLSDKQRTRSYLFEPDIPQILMFFEKQIFTSVFEQVVRESQLAKFASRIMVMDQANQNIAARLKVIDSLELKAGHRAANRKQLNQLASMALWF